MTSQEFKTVQDFENGLSIGDQVRIKWTNSYCYFSGLATICKINAKSVIATLNHEVHDYPENHKIKAPRFTFTTMDLWSCNNRIEPVQGY